MMAARYFWLAMPCNPSTVFAMPMLDLFLNAQRHPVGPVQCTPLTLSSNFRSQEGIIEWVNSAFTEAFPAHADISRGAIPYSPSVAVKAADEAQAVHFQGFAGDDHKVDEAHYIATLCSELRDNHSWGIHSHPSSGTRSSAQYYSGASRGQTLLAGHRYHTTGQQNAGD